MLLDHIIQGISWFIFLVLQAIFSGCVGWGLHFHRVVCDIILPTFPLFLQKLLTNCESSSSTAATSMGNASSFSSLSTAHTLWGIGTLIVPASWCEMMLFATFSAPFPISKACFLICNIMGLLTTPAFIMYYVLDNIIYKSTKKNDSKLLGLSHFALGQSAFV